MTTLTRTLTHIGLVFGVVLSITCSSGPTTAPPPDTGSRELSVSLDSNSGGVGERIAIDGIPNDVTPAWAVVTVPGTAAASSPPTTTDDPETNTTTATTNIAFIRKSDKGHELLVPSHPTTPFTGGAVEVRVTDGANITSNKVSLDIDALPKAPGAFEELVTKLEALLDAWLVRHGTTAETLRTTPVDQLSPLELPLRFIHIAVDHPDNPNSLRAFADGDIPIWQGEVIDRDLLDAFAALTGLSDYFDERTAFVDTVDTPPPDAVLGRANGGQTAAARICFEAPHFGIDPSNCAKLAEVMAYQAELTHENNSAAGKVVDSVGDIVLTALGATRAAYAAWAIGNTLWASDNITSGSMGLYPGMFISDRTDYGAGPLLFAEDFTDPGEWSDFKVTAASEGWRVDDVIRSAYKKAKGVDADTFESEALNDVIGGELSGEVDGAITKSFQDPLYDEVVDGLGVEDLTTIEYCAQIWEDIDCTGLPYSRGDSPSLEVDDVAKTYEPTEVGVTTLNVGTTGVFGRAQPTSETKQIETRGIVVSVDPFRASADVSEPVNFIATVTNAVNTNVDWYTEGSLPGNVMFNGNNATVVTPVNPWDPPIELFARSKANTGLRENLVNSDPREDSSTITFGNAIVLVMPASACLAPNDTITFTASLVPGTVNSVSWRIEPAGAGQITQGGVYTAPAAPLNNPVMVIATVNGAFEGGAIVTVGACACYWTADVSGAVGATHSGNLTAASGGGGVITGIGFDEDTYPSRFVATTPPFSGVGEHEIFLFYSAGPGGDVYSSGIDPALALPKLFVDEFVAEEYLVGRITGQLAQLENPGPPATYKHVSVSMEFKSQIWSLGEPMCGGE